MKVEIDRGGIAVDGIRRLIRAAELPYHRLPSPVLWEDRIARMRDAGLDAVSVSYPWSYHSRRRGDCDFEDERDVSRLHDLIEAAGLWLIARPGPYLGLGLDLGGLPAWLLREPGVVLRCRDARGYRHSPAYLECAGEWFDQIVPRFGGRDNLLWVQVENGWLAPEPLAGLPLDLLDLAVRWLGTPRLSRWLGGTATGRRLRDWLTRPRPGALDAGQTSAHLRELIARVRARGVEVPIAHADRWSDCARQLDVDLPALNFAPLAAEHTPAERRDALAACLGHAADLARVRLDVPLVYGQLQAGVTELRDSPGPAALRETLGPALGDGLAKMALAGGAAAWCWDPFCGGATPGYLGAPEARSAQDGAAPLDASGAPTPAWEALRDLDAFLEPYIEDLIDTETVQEPGTWCPEHLGTRAGAGRLYAFLWNPRERSAGVPVPEAERAELAPWEVQIRVYRPDRTLEAVSPPLPRPAPGAPAGAARALETWESSDVSPQLDVAYDDEHWDPIEPDDVEGRRTDIDSLGLHHGFVWYRGSFTGDLDRLLLDARHSWSAWINGEQIARGDAVRNAHGLGPDGARLRRVALDRVPFNERRNALVLLVESLGHGQYLAGAERGRRGLLRIDTGETPVSWRFRGGLLRGEQGIAPVVAASGIERSGTETVRLPHTPRGDRLVLYETRFQGSGLDDAGLDPSTPAPVLALEAGDARVNVYLNGHLLGLHRPERDPERQRHPLPWGVLDPAGENHLALAIWSRGARSALRSARLQVP